MKIFALICLSLSPLLCADTVIREDVRTGIRQKSVRVEPGSFTEAHLEYLTRAELSRVPKANFLRLLVYGMEGGLPLPQLGPPADIGAWLRVYDEIAKKNNEVGEMIAIGNKASLRMQDQNGRIIRHVLERSDPLQIDVDGDQLRIVWLHFSDGGRALVNQGARVYVHTDDSVTPQTGLKLLAMLDQVLPGWEVSVHISNDARFLGIRDFPFVNPLEDTPTPTEEDFRDFEKRRVLVCGHWQPTPTCHQQ